MQIDATVTNFSPLKMLGLTVENGYIIDTFYHISPDYCEVVYFDESNIVKKIKDHNIYLHYSKSSALMRHNSISHDEFLQIMNEISEKSTRYYCKFKKDGNCNYCKEIKPNIYVKEEYQKIIQNIIDKMKKFENISINILLHGEPGTGKSSFVEYIADQFKSNIYVVPPLDTNELAPVFSTLSSKKSCVVLIPEMDKMLDIDGKPLKNESEFYEFLDGMNRPANSLILITCNDVARIKKNPVICRPGRINFELEFGLISEQEIKFIINKYFPEITDYSAFMRYAGKVSQAEFNNEVCNHYIMDRPISEFQLNIAKKTRNHMYY